MKEIQFPYGKTRLSHSFSEDELAGVLCSSIESYRAEASGVQLVKNALEAPVGSERLCELAKNKEKIVLKLILILCFLMAEIANGKRIIPPKTNLIAVIAAGFMLAAI